MMEAVIQKNRRNQEEARELNVRAGSDVFPLMSHDEWRDWLASRLNGARRTTEVADFDSLLLPQLDPELVQLVIAENPDTVTIEGVSLQIEYGKEYYGGTGTFCRTDVEEEFARKCSSKAVLLPSGRTVEVRCSGYSAKSFTELVEKLERNRIEQCWSTARSQHGTSWTGDSAKVVGWLPRVGSQVETTRTDNGAGDPIYGYVGLKWDSGWSEWHLFLADAKEKADEETQKSLEVLVKSAVKDQFAIPQEGPWQRSSPYYGWSLTDLGKVLQARYETLVHEHAEGLNSSNVEERIKALKAALEKTMLEVGGEHESTERIVEDAKTGLEGKIDSLDDEDFVSSEIEEARELIREAEEAVDSGSYAAAKEKCEKVEDVWQQAQDRIAQRQARVEKGEVLINFEAWHRRGGMSNTGDGWVIRPDGSLRERDTDDVRRHKSDGRYRWHYVNEDELALKWSCGTMRDVGSSSEFVVAKMPVSGITEAQREAVRRIELEDIGTAENSFGLDPEAVDRQAKVIDETANAFPACPACGEQLVYDESTYRSVTDEYGIHICQDDHRISRLVNWNKPFNQRTEGRDAQVVSSKRITDGVIEALAYEKWGGWNINLRLRNKLTEEELALAEEAVHEEETAQGDGNFTFVGGRHFKCSCGCQERVTKGEMRTYKSGGTLDITCSICGAEGKVSEDMSEDSGETDDQSMKSGLDALKRKWGWGSH